MEKVIIISSHAATLQSISSALPAGTSIHSIASISDAYQIEKSFSFDLVFIDFQSIKDAAGAFSSERIFSLFKKNNPLIEFIIIAQKEGIPKTFNLAKEHAASLLMHPVEEAEIRQAYEFIREKKIKDFELDYLRDHFWKTDWLDVIYSRNPVMKRVYENIKTVAPTVAAVLLLGETGTGKGLLARLIHRHSNRYEQPFIAVHCGALPETLIESEMFGHEKGAFTGADHRKYGKFEIARGGTIFLDEIGTITANAQIKLLQVLQDGMFSRVGGTEQLNTDARIITATNADLEQLADKGQFRKDLYYRLNVFPIEIPPLRDRLEDIPHLVDMFLGRLDAKYGKKIHRIHPAVMEGFKSYDWPGNIRELENVLERANLLETGNMLNPQNFPRSMVMLTPFIEDLSDREEPTLAQARQIATEKFEHEYLTNLLKIHKGRINLSAEKAGITPRQLNRLLARHHINKKEFKG